MSEVGGHYIVVDSEEAAWDAIELILDRKIDARNVTLDLSQTDWANFHINFKGDGFNQSLTASTMRGLVDYQEAIYRSAALLLKGDAKITRLTDSERDDYELNFDVKAGSTDLSASALKFLSKFGGQILDKMSSEHILLCILLVIVCYFTGSGWNKFLARSGENKRIDTDAAKDRLIRDLASQALRDSADKTKLLDRVLRRSEKARVIEAESTKAFDSIVRHAGGVSQLTIQGHVVPRETLDRLTQSSRRSAEKVTIKALFTVSNVDTKNPGGFIVRFEEVGGEGRTITADLKDAILADRYRKVIERATFSKKPIRVTLAARKIGEDYRNAEILKASTPRA